MPPALTGLAATSVTAITQGAVPVLTQLWMVPLHQHVASLQVHAADVELHIDPPAQ